MNVFTSTHCNKEDQPDGTRNTTTRVHWNSLEQTRNTRNEVRTSTNVEDTSGDPPDGERGGLGPSRKDLEQDVDDMFLAHENTDKKIGNDSVRNLPGIRLVGRSKANKYGHIGRKGETEKPPVNGEEQIAEVSNRLGVPLLDVLIV